ncbi:MAG: cell division protein FtsX [Myxococcaceae bacterium]
MTALSKLSYFARAAGQDFRHAPFVHLAAVVTLGVSLFVLGMLRLATHVMETGLGMVQGGVQLHVYLDATATEADAQRLRAEAEQRAGGRAIVVSPAEALDRLTETLGDVRPGWAVREQNPLPYTVDVALPRRGRSLQEVAALATTLRALPNVEDVDYGAEALARMARVTQWMRWLTGGVLVLLAFATVVTVAATLQLAVYARRSEIEIQKLVGATNAFVRAPFLLEGALQGLVGATVAAVALWATGRWAAPIAQEAFSFLGLSSEGLLRPPGRHVVELFVAGATLGLLGSWSALRRFSHV